MMIAPALMLALMSTTSQAAATPAQEPPIVVPTDWTAMPPLPWRSEPAVTPDLTRFVVDEVRAGRCAMPGTVLTIELAVYVRGDGMIRAVVPRAIRCPTVEQFAAGLVTSFARSNLRASAAGWYRATLVFDWSK